MKYILILLSFLVSLSSCYTIHFSKTSQSPPQEYQFTSWHHIGLSGLFEFSDPVNLKEICSEQGDWSSVRVQTGFVQLLVTGLTNNLYSPKKVSIQCVAGSSSLN